MKFIRILVHDYGWIHLGIGVMGNALFLIGSILFLPDWGTLQLPLIGSVVAWQTVGTWLFIIGAAMMLLGSLGELLVSIYARRKDGQ